MSNGINIRQNEEKSIMYLAAQRQIYSEVKRKNILKGLCIVVFPLICSVLQTFIGNNAVLSVLPVLTMLLWFVSFLLNDYIKKEKETAAYIQQEFDMYVYQMPWDNRLFGEKRNIHIEIINKSKSIMKNQKKRNKLLNWYTITIDSMELKEGILACQEENISWDMELRKRYKKVSIILITGLILLIFIIGVVNNEAVLVLLLRFAFVLPLLRWLLETEKQLNNDIDNLMELDALVYSETEKDMDKLQEIQHKIYNHRKSCYAIPDFFYKLFKAKDEEYSGQIN